VSQTIRGFTGQEMLASVGLVHLNGRVYDPYIGRMMSADPVVGDPLNGQTWNRYSYVYNNPLAFTDPIGYCPLCLGTFFSRIGNGIGKFLQRNPLVGQALVIASAAVCTVAGGGPICAGIASSVSNFIVTGLSTGRLDMALKAAAVTAATAAAFYGVGDMTQQFLPINPETGLRAQMQFGDAAHLFNIAGHALVGCGAAVAAGGQCGPGALSGAVPSLAGPLVNNLPFQAALVANSTLGGLASVAGGGKFLNGAVTGAFGYLFNQAQHEINQLDVGNDAHRTLQAYAAQDPSYFTEASTDDRGAWFGGRVDIGNVGTGELWEIKPDNAIGIFSGRVQVEYYSIVANATGPNEYSPGGVPGVYGAVDHACRPIWLVHIYVRGRRRNNIPFRSLLTVRARSHASPQDCSYSEPSAFIESTTGAALRNKQWKMRC
jgi:RHS repeat-associated protein